MYVWVWMLVWVLAGVEQLQSLRLMVGSWDPLPVYIVFLFFSVLICLFFFFGVGLISILTCHECHNSSAENWARDEARLQSVCSARRELILADPAPNASIGAGSSRWNGSQRNWNWIRRCDCHLSMGRRRERRIESSFTNVGPETFDWNCWEMGQRWCLCFVAFLSFGRVSVRSNKWNRVAIKWCVT